MPPLVNVTAFPNCTFTIPVEEPKEPAPEVPPVAVPTPDSALAVAPYQPAVPDEFVTIAEPPPGPAAVAAWLLVTDTALPAASPFTCDWPPTWVAPKLAVAPDMAPDMAWAVPLALALPVVAARLDTLPMVATAPPTTAPPTARLLVPKPKLPVVAPAEAPEDAVFTLSAAPVPALAALALVSDADPALVAAVAMAELLTVADAIPVKATTARAMIFFFMKFFSSNCFSEPPSAGLVFELERLKIYRKSQTAIIHTFTLELTLVIQKVLGARSNRLDAFDR